MSTHNYQPLQMHRYNWTDLTESEISRALRGVEFSQPAGRIIPDGNGQVAGADGIKSVA